MDVVKIGAFIKAQRTELNMTQKDLAEKLVARTKLFLAGKPAKGYPICHL